MPTAQPLGPLVLAAPTLPTVGAERQARCWQDECRMRMRRADAPTSLQPKTGLCPFCVPTVTDLQVHPEPGLFSCFPEHLKVPCTGTSLVVQWLRLHAHKAGGAGSIPGWGTKIPHAAWNIQKITKKKKGCPSSTVKTSRRAF